MMPMTGVSLAIADCSLRGKRQCSRRRVVEQQDSARAPLLRMPHRRRCVLRLLVALALRWCDWGSCAGGCPPDTGYGVMREAAPDQRSSHRRAAMTHYAGLDV